MNDDQLDVSKSSPKKPGYGEGIAPEQYDDKYKDAVTKALTIPESYGITLTDETTKLYIDAIDNYIVEKTIFDDPPTLGAIKDGLIELKKSADSFAECISKFEPHRLARFLYLQATGRSALLDEAKNMASDISHAAYVGYYTIENQKGVKSQDNAIKNLVIALYGIYMASTGKKPTISNTDYKTPFVSYVYDVLAKIDEPPQSYGALSQRIYRIIKEAKIS